MSPEPLYTKEELLAINDTIQNSNTIIPEPEELRAEDGNKKSKVSVIQWLEIKKHLKKFEDFIFESSLEGSPPLWVLITKSKLIELSSFCSLLISLEDGFLGSLKRWSRCGFFSKTGIE